MFSIVVQIVTVAECSSSVLQLMSVLLFVLRTGRGCWNVDALTNRNKSFFLLISIINCAKDIQTYKRVKERKTANYCNGQFLEALGNVGGPEDHLPAHQYVTGEDKRAARRLQVNL